MRLASSATLTSSGATVTSVDAQSAPRLIPKAPCGSGSSSGAAALILLLGQVLPGHAGEWKTLEDVRVTGYPLGHNEGIPWFLYHLGDVGKAVEGARSPPGSSRPQDFTSTLASPKSRRFPQISIQLAGWGRKCRHSSPKDPKLLRSCLFLSALLSFHPPGLKAGSYFLLYLFFSDFFPLQVMTRY